MSEPTQEQSQPTPADMARTSSPQAQAKPADELPDWARKQISDANAEAARYRVQLREAETARKSLEEQMVTISAEKSDTSQSLSGVKAEFDKLVTAIKAEVPHQHVFAFAKTLQGATEDELEAHAAELKGMFGLNPGPARAVDRFQGQGSGSGDAQPAAQFASIIKGILNS